MTDWLHVLFTRAPLGLEINIVFLNSVYPYPNIFLHTSFFYNFNGFFIFNLLNLYEIELEFFKKFFGNFDSILNIFKLTDFSKNISQQEIENEKFTNNILSIIEFPVELEINHFKQDCFFVLEHYKNLNCGLYIHWFSAFLITLGIFFIWCSKAIEEGSSVRLTTQNLIKYSKNLFITVKILPLFHSNIVR